VLKRVAVSRRYEGMEQGSRQPRWYPTTNEVQKILDELKPIIAELARRDRVTLARELVKSGPGIA
jgi:hypothetical protein